MISPARAWPQYGSTNGRSTRTASTAPNAGGTVQHSDPPRPCISDGTLGSMRRDTHIRRIASVPPFTSLLVREKALRTVRLLKRQRRLLFEGLQRSRFSRPAINGLDAKLEQYLPDKPGFFVEAGAHDGFTASNTYFVERFKGWTGVLVEPIPALYRKCVHERPRSKVFNFALVRKGGPKEVSMVYRGPRSGLADCEGAHEDMATSHLDWERTYEVRVPARTLTSILDEAGAGHIDLLIMDVEGYEVEALRGLDLSRYAPTLMLIETNGAQRELQALFADRYELVGDLSPKDSLYKRVDERGVGS